LRDAPSSPFFFTSIFDGFDGASLADPVDPLLSLWLSAEAGLSVAEFVVSGTTLTSFPLADAMRVSKSDTSDAFGEMTVGPKMLRMLFFDDAGLLAAA
jgi:hypothetical protein